MFEVGEMLCMNQDNKMLIKQGKIKQSGRTEGLMISWPTFGANLLTREKI